MTDQNEVPPTQPGVSPFVVGLIALLLLIGGWKISNWVPPREGRQGELYSDVRRMAGDSELGQKMDDIGRPDPPFQLAGRLAFFLGLGLFVLTVGLMWRTPEPVERPPDAVS